MGSDFGSFNASPLGAFIESPLGARGGAESEPEILTGTPLQAERDFKLTGEFFGETQGTVRRTDEEGTSLTIISWSDTEIVATWLNVPPPSTETIFVVRDDLKFDSIVLEVVALPSGKMWVETIGFNIKVNNCPDEGQTNVGFWEKFFLNPNQPDTLDAALRSAFCVGLTSGTSFQMLPLSCIGWEQWQGGRHNAREFASLWIWEHRNPIPSGFIHNEDYEIRVVDPNE